MKIILFRNYIIFSVLFCIISCQNNEEDYGYEYYVSHSVNQSKSDGFFIAYYTPDKSEIKLKDGSVFNIPNAWVEKQHYRKNGKIVLGDGIYITVPILKAYLFDLTTSQINEKPLCGEYNNWNPKTGFVTQVIQQTYEVMFYVKEGKYFDEITHVITFSQKSNLK